MKPILTLYLILITLIMVAGCVANNITSPSNLMTCYTQPRLYWSPDGTSSRYEIDHYEAISCPIVPID